MSFLSQFLRTRILPTRPAQLILKTFHKWQRDECLEMGAALSYYALFSIFPIFLVILSVAGFFLGPNSNAVDQLLTSAQLALPPMAYEIFEDALLHLNKSSIGAGTVGFFLLLITSSNVFGALDRAVDKIWKVYKRKRRSSSFWESMLTTLKDRVLAFSLVLASSILMLISLLFNISLKTLRRILVNFDQLFPTIHIDDVLILRNIQIGATFLLLCFVIGVLFKILPSTSVHWRDIWPSTLITAGLMIGLQQLISNSIIKIGSQYQSYGLVGGVMVLMMWLYFTCQIFFIGSTLSYVYAHLYGSRRDRDRPNDNVSLDEPELSA